MVGFRLKILQGTEEESRRRRELAQLKIARQLANAVADLRAAKARNDQEEISNLETRVLPGLLLRLRVDGIALPKGLKASIKFTSVTWNREPGLQHLESLGFVRPTSRRKLKERVRAFVRNLFLDGKGKLLPEDLVTYDLTLFVGLSGP